jgi:hypothetical protein
MHLVFESRDDSKNIKMNSFTIGFVSSILCMICLLVNEIVNLKYNKDAGFMEALIDRIEYILYGNKEIDNNEYVCILPDDTLNIV